MEEKNFLFDLNWYQANTTSKHHLTSQHCWNTVCVLNIWSPL